MQKRSIGENQAHPQGEMEMEMEIGWQEQSEPAIAFTKIVQQTTEALIGLDSERLQELARCCADLNREIEKNGDRARAAIAIQSAEADLSLLGRVLSKTRANLTVLLRLNRIRLAEPEGLQQHRASNQLSHGGIKLELFDRAERLAAYGDN
jgi:hypothetical protein